MAIQYLSDKVSVPSFRRRDVSHWIEEVAKSYGKQVSNISYLFCDDETILDYNRRYLNHDYYTDVITFDQSIGNQIFADLVISIETVRSNAEMYNQSYEEELLRVMIHGLLHICGEDDKSDEAIPAMRQAEAKALALLPEDKKLIWRK